MGHPAVESHPSKNEGGGTRREAVLTSSSALAQIPRHNESGFRLAVKLTFEERSGDNDLVIGLDRNGRSGGDAAAKRCRDGATGPKGALALSLRSVAPP